MPELPEVEIVARTLEPEIIGKVITDVQVIWPRIVNYPDDKEEFKDLLRGQILGPTRRIGKYLLIQVGEQQELVVHFRMTGKFKILTPEESKQKHVHMFFQFEGEAEGLAYHDVRKFGDVFLIPKGDYRQIKGLYHAGIDPLSSELTLPVFKELLISKNRKIKPLLLDQSVICGLGNYLCDEILWFPEQEGIHPERLSSTLTKEELNKMYTHMMEVIHKSISLGGNSFRNFSYGDGVKGDFKKMLKVYAREGEPCDNCSSEILRIQVGGRSSHFCPVCQRRPLAVRAHKPTRKPAHI